MKFFENENNKRLWEFFGFFLALFIGLGPRIWFIHKFPIEQRSDFLNILEFAQALQQNLFAPGWWWHYFAPGIPLILGGVLNLLPGISPNTVALWATAIVSGLISLAPYLIWKNVFPIPIRILGAILLGIWPAQVYYSNTLAQDNWVLLPAVTLAALSIRTLAKPERTFPILGSILYALALSIRQDMLLVLLPLLFSTCFGTNFDIKQQWRAGIKSLIALSIALGFLIVQRGVASGRYALSSEHLGLALVGTYAPGSGLNWVVPWGYLERVHPQPIPDDQLEKVSTELALQEFSKRPGFHMVRMATSVYYYTNNMETLLWWSLPDRPIGNKNTYIGVHLFIIHSLFLMALFVFFWQSKVFKYTWQVILAILLKLGLHAVTVSQPRYFLIVLAFEILLITVAMDEILKGFSFKLTMSAIAAGILSFSGITVLGNSAKDYVLEHTWGIEQDEFSLSISEVSVTCKAENAQLMYFFNNVAAFNFRTTNPVPGDSATLLCTASSKHPHQLILSFEDSFGGEGSPNHVAYVITANNQQIIWHDIGAKTWTGWVENVNLGTIDNETPLAFTISIQMLEEDPGREWGNSSHMIFKLDTR